MFKHILVPTDGSPVSTKAAKAAIALAKESGARVTGYSAVEPVPARLYGEGYVVDRQDVAEFERRSREHAKKHVAAIERAARKAGVRSSCSSRPRARPTTASSRRPRSATAT